MYKRSFIIAILLVIYQQYSFGQRYTDADLNKAMDDGVNAMELNEHLQADSLFRIILRNKRKLPSELAYYFGKNSYYLKQYKQAINWLSKYVQLKGSRGIHFENASIFLKRSEDEFRNEQIPIKPKESKKEVFPVTSIVFIDEIECDTDKVKCPVCNGNGVIVVSGKYEKIYKTCPYSGLKGYMSCEEYNSFMNGSVSAK